MAKIVKLKRLLLLFGALLIHAALLTGCGENYYRGEAELLDRLPLQNVDITVRMSKEDFIFSNRNDIFSMSLEGDAKFFTEKYFQNTAAAKRKAALLLGRDLFYYKLLNYSSDQIDSSLSPSFLLAIRFDGVSGFLYNTAYLSSLPYKMLRSFQVSCGFWNWLADICSLLLGGGVALLMGPASLIIGTLCHPIETLANLTIGIFYWPPETISLFSSEYFSAWWDYICNTNLLASIWDLIWGAILYPLLQAVIFFIILIILVVGVIFFLFNSDNKKRA